MAAVSIVDLLKYKMELDLKHPMTGQVIGTVWIKIMGDEDVKEAFKYARLKSAEMRKKMKDPESIEYKLRIDSLDEQEDDDLKELIIASKKSTYTRESIAVVIREELPSLSEVAVEPDAPSLEEQEKLDEKEAAVEDRFTEAINKYVGERTEVLEAELKKATKKKLIEMAKVEIQDLEPMQAFKEALDDQKGFRSTFTDKTCKVKVFADLDEYINQHSAIKLQIVSAYESLEIGPEELKK